MEQQELLKIVDTLKTLCFNEYKCEIKGEFNDKEKVMKIIIQKNNKSDDAK